MIRPLWASRSALLAAGVFTAAAAFMVVAGWRWATITPVAVAPASPQTDRLPVATPPDPPSLDVVLAAVDKDLFHPKRRRPRARFQLPGERRSVARPAPRPPTLPATLQLTGTMVYPNGGGAALVRDQGRSRMVRVGERIGNFTLQRVGREEAVFRGPNGRDIVVRVSRARS